MKRFHVNVGVKDLSESIQFYSSLFGKRPTVEKPDYAKWMLDDPYVNFSISTRGGKTGVDHVGIQAENESEFEEIRERLNMVGTPTMDQPEVVCCYSKSTKAWTYDPDGIAWETFLTRGNSTVFSDMTTDTTLRIANEQNNASSCCTPKDSCSEA